MSANINNTFSPPFYLRHPAAQTVLASSRLRKLGSNPMLKAEKHHIVEAGNGVRLSGYHSPTTASPAKGMVILLHGWEGSSHSTYILNSGRFYHRHNLAVFRLNLRDHGNSHHLNRGLFYATRLEEVFQAVKQAALFSNGTPVFLAGFSLGGNFALRIAHRCLRDPIPALEHIVSISPVLDPDKATDKIDGNPFLLSYFIRKWKKSLRNKQRLFPERYNFNDILEKKTIRRMTELLLDRYSTYPDTTTYFKGYGIYDSDLAVLGVPTTIITAADDPVIPVADFYSLKLPSSVNLMIHTHGGHNGFIDSLLGPAWHERFMLHQM